MSETPAGEHSADYGLPVCHPRCSLGTGADHPGYLEYRCVTDDLTTLPWPGEDGYEASVFPSAETAEGSSDE